MSAGARPLQLSADQIFAAIAGAAATFGGGWNSLLLVGQFPEPAPELRDYSAAWLARRFCAQQLRVSSWNPTAQVSAVWPAVAALTAGIAGLDRPAEIVQPGDARPFHELEWPAPPIAHGFVLERSAIRANGGALTAEIPLLSLAAGAELPGPAAYAELRGKASEASALLHAAGRNAGDNARLERLLAEALRINPTDEEALRTGAAYYLERQNFPAAAAALASLTQVRPHDAALQTQLGDCEFRAGNADAAETALLAARSHGLSDIRSSEDLARIHLARKDDAGALPFLDEALKLDSRRVELWFLRADVLLRRDDWVRAADSMEKGLAIQDELARRTALIELYLNHSASPRALEHVRHAAAALPADASVRRQYASFFDRLDKPDEALALWKKVLESDPALEAAHVRIADLLLAKGDVSAALIAAETGLAVAPNSSRLYLTKAAALERQGHYFEARETLRSAPAAAADAVLLARLAEMEDATGLAAPAAYRKLLAAMDKTSTAGPAVLSALERGLETAVRDGDANAATDFRARLVTRGRQDVVNRLSMTIDARRTGAVVPGGLESLEFLAQFHSRSAQHFFADYCRALADHTLYVPKDEANRYIESIRGYFQVVDALKASGTRQGERVAVALSAVDKKARQRTAPVLDLLGFKVRANKDDIAVSAGEKGAQAKRQEIASALAIDEVRMQETLEAGKEFRFEIIDGRAPVVLDESRWLSTFFPKQTFPGGFAEALTHDLRVPKTYAALSAMSAHAVSILTSGSDLKLMVERHADLLYMYSSAFALNGLRAAVPGGTAAEPVWEKLTGAPPANPSRFFRALLEKDEGKLLAFFFAAGELDDPHQRFLTRNAARAGRYYDLFKESRDVAHSASKQALHGEFSEFLREIPLDDQGEVLFPGGPEVWLLAKGISTSMAKTTKMAGKLTRVAVPSEEDDILLRLLHTAYTAADGAARESDNFVAVVHIERHRTEPLDGPSALLLAQHHGTYAPLYPYFAALTALERPHFEQFFALMEKLHQAPRHEMNVVLGDLHSLLALLCLAQDAGTLAPKAAAEVFGLVTARFQKAAGEADYARASLDSIRDLIRRAGQPASAEDPDRALESVLTRASGPVAFEMAGVRYQVNPDAARATAYRRVLSEQKVPSLRVLLEIYDAAMALAAGNGAAADRLAALDKLRAGLIEVEPPKELKLDQVDRKIAFDFAPRRVADTIARIKHATARKKVNREEVAKLCQELLAAIGPEVKLALTGVVYAYYLRPDDLLIADDALLLRKHRFVDPQSPRVAPATLFTMSLGAGSYIGGGFADFAPIAGQLALSGSKLDSTGEFVARAQMASMRVTGWGKLTERDLVAFELRVRAAREWLLHAAVDERLLSGLAGATVGLLSPTRRAQLLDGVATRDWDEAFQAVTLADLLYLADRYLELYDRDLWQSPALTALRKLPTAEPDLQALGGSSVQLQGCSHPHLAAAGTYEEYEKLLLPYKLAERTAEFKLYLAKMSAEMGVPPAALNVIAEPVARQILGTLHMTNRRDWQSAILAFGRLDAAALTEALKNQK